VFFSTIVISFNVSFLNVCIDEISKFLKRDPNNEDHGYINLETSQIILHILTTYYLDVNFFNLNLSLALRSTFCMVKFQYIVFLALNTLMLVSITIDVSNSLVSLQLVIFSPSLSFLRIFKKPFTKNSLLLLVIDFLFVFFFQGMKIKIVYEMFHQFFYCIWMTTWWHTCNPLTIYPIIHDHLTFVKDL
jgi:hypothetical protein